jgi:hypothetical protein
MRKSFGDPIMNAKETKQLFLRGQPTKVTEYLELKDPKKTSYQDTMKGKAHDDKAAIVDYERTSCGMGGIIPDPVTVNKNSQRIKKF